MNSIIEDAMGMCYRAHFGQVRKYTNEPYIVHPFAVAGLVRSVTSRRDITAAAFLHDVIEDTAYSYGDIKNLCGSYVADLVIELTDISKPGDGNRAVRKNIDLGHIARASKEAKTIKLADLIDNTKSIVAFDKDFARVYMAEKKALLKVLTEGSPSLFKIASDMVRKWEVEYAR